MLSDWLSLLSLLQRRADIGRMSIEKRGELRSEIALLQYCFLNEPIAGVYPDRPLRGRSPHLPLIPSDGGCSSGFSDRSSPIDRWSTEQRYRGGFTLLSSEQQ